MVRRSIDYARLARIAERDADIKADIRMRAQAAVTSFERYLLPKPGQFFLEQVKAMRTSMRTGAATIAILAALALPAKASSITYGSSYDGTPPGTFADIAGDGATLGAPDFDAGTWRISVDGGYSAWHDRDTVGFEGDTACAESSTCHLSRNAGTVLEVFMDRPWHLIAETPDLFHVTSNGTQFAILQTSATTWRYGLEDMLHGDFDYQDVFGTLTLVRPIGGSPVALIGTDPPTSAVPESGTLVLVGLGLTIVRKAVTR